MTARRVTLLALTVLLLAAGGRAQEDAVAAPPAPTAPTAPVALEKLDNAVEKTRAGIDKAANLVRAYTTWSDWAPPCGARRALLRREVPQLGWPDRRPRGRERAETNASLPARPAHQDPLDLLVRLQAETC